MAQEVAIPGAGTTAKIRHPLAIIGLGIITLGIYHVFWWYFINREMADLGRATRRSDLGDNPIMSVLAVTIGAFIIVPPFVSFWRTLKRIETSQNVVLGSNNFAVILLFILGLIPLVNIIVAPLMQSNLNQVWEAGARPAGSLDAPSAAPAVQPAAAPERPAEPAGDQPG
jgi:Domain of unknown function (DUF4234)